MSEPNIPASAAGAKPGDSGKKLKKSLGLFSVFAVATGSTLSAGFFLLPGMAAREAGPAMVFAYLLATLPLIPAALSIVELCTAMPRAGGMYYFLDRGLGPLFGTIGGIGTWMALVLKVSFALVGMGFYISLFIPDLGKGSVTTIAVTLAIILGFLNLGGSKKSGGLQSVLVVGLLTILLVFIGGGVPNVNLDHFQNFWGAGFENIIAAAGLVYISYGGVTSVASLSEEVVNPEKNLPRGVFLSLGAALFIYAFGTAVMVGVIPMEKLQGTMTPVAMAANEFFGYAGVVVISIAAIMAFTSVANAGTMSASRYPLALSRDHILPELFRKLTPNGTPVNSVVVSVSVIVLVLIFLDPLKIAKLASAFQFLMFSLICLTVIVMRESRIESYDPGYKSPFYPWMQLVGIVLPFWFIVEMGWLPTVFSLGLVSAGVFWYFYYARKRINRNGAIYHIFERLGRQRYEGLDFELREILKEKGLRDEDPFAEVVTRSHIVEVRKSRQFEQIVELVVQRFAQDVPHTEEELSEAFLAGTRVGATPVSHGVALPHFRSTEVSHPRLIIIKAAKGVKIELNPDFNPRGDDEELVYALFFLISPKSNPTQHLRMLAQIADRVDDEGFEEAFREAKDEQEIKELLIQNDRSLSLELKPNTPSESLIGLPLYKTELPNDCLIALLRRNDNKGISRVIIPRGNTVLKEGDRLTIIGEVAGLRTLRKRFGMSKLEKGV